MTDVEFPVSGPLWAAISHRSSGDHRQYRFVSHIPELWDDCLHADCCGRGGTGFLGRREWKRWTL